MEISSDERYREVGNTIEAKCLVQTSHITFTKRIACAKRTGNRGIFSMNSY
jgi:hypothetical protein